MNRMPTTTDDMPVEGDLLLCRQRTPSVARGLRRHTVSSGYRRSLVQALAACSLLASVGAFAPLIHPTATRLSSNVAVPSSRTTTSPLYNSDMTINRRHSVAQSSVGYIARNGIARRMVGRNSAAEDDGLKSETGPPFQVTLEGDNYSYEDAIKRSLGWAGAAAVFGGLVWAILGSTAGEEFFAGYLVEQSLSVDNLFVFLILFDYFKVPVQYQDRVLNWGIYGAVVMRGIMIGLGAAALESFHAILLVFAGILVYSSAKFFIGAGDDEEEDPSENTIVKFSRRLIDSTDFYDGDRFFTMVDGVRLATPLFICMIAVEISDVVFAVDSIPAVFGITENPLIVFSSNIFAIMGLRSLYTILSKAATDLVYLEPAVALVLGFIGSKMIGEYFGYCIPINIALGVVATLLGTGIGASVYEKQQALDEESSP